MYTADILLPWTKRFISHIFQTQRIKFLCALLVCGFLVGLFQTYNDESSWEARGPDPSEVASTGKTAEGGEAKELLLNRNFYQGKRYWRDFVPWSKESKVKASKYSEHSLFIKSDKLQREQVTGQFQFVDLVQPTKELNRRQQSTSETTSYYLYVSAKVHLEAPLGGTLMLDLHAKAADGSYLYDQTLVFYDSFLEEELELSPDSPHWQPQERCLIVESRKPLDYAIVYLLKQSWGHAFVDEVSLKLLANNNNNNHNNNNNNQQNNNKDHDNPFPSSSPYSRCSFIRQPSYHVFNQYTIQPKAVLSAGKTFNEPVTIVTQLSLDRIDRLVEIARSWKGPVSVGLYLKNEDEILRLRHLIDKYYLHNVDFHFVFADGGPYPVNVLRNVAMDHVETEFVILLDVDFKPCSYLHEYSVDFIKKYGDTMKLNKTVYSIAAFEVDEGVVAPETREQLLDTIERGIVRVVHSKFASEAMAATKYEAWYDAVEPYPIQYEGHFEPYVLVHRDIIRFDERFKGYGWDKVSYFYEIEMSHQYRWAVMPQAFVVHLYHPPGVWKKEQPRIYIRIWQNWWEFAFDVYKRYWGDSFNYQEFYDQYKLDLIVSNPKPKDISGLFLKYVRNVDGLVLLGYLLVNLAEFLWCHFLFASYYHYPSSSLSSSRPHNS